MTLTEAFTQFIQSEDFKTIAKKQDSEGKKYRIYAGRFKRGELKAGAITELLLANGYEIKAKKVTKKK
jgi:hypothetical protein